MHSRNFWTASSSVRWIALALASWLVAPQAQAGTRYHTLDEAVKAISMKLNNARTALSGKIDQAQASLSARIDQERAELKSKIDAVDARLGGKIDAVDARIDAVSGKVDTVRSELSARIDAVSGKVDTVRSELSARIDAVSNKIDTVRSELNGRIDAADAKLSGKIDGLDTKLSGRMDGLSGKIDSVQQQQRFSAALQKEAAVFQRAQGKYYVAGANHRLARIDNLTGSAVWSVVYGLDCSVDISVEIPEYAGYQSFGSGQFVFFDAQSELVQERAETNAVPDETPRTISLGSLDAVGLRLLGWVATHGEPDAAGGTLEVVDFVVAPRLEACPN